MKLLLVLLAVSIFSGCGQTQTPTKQITEDLEKDVNGLLPSSQVTVDIMDEVAMSPRRAELTAKVKKSMEENKEWWLEQMQIAQQTGKPVPYDELFGVTEPEWKEYEKLQSDMSDLTAKSSGQVSVTITRTADRITFKAEEPLEELNNYAIDIKKNVVLYGDYTLTPKAMVNVTNANHIFKTPWRAYQWEFSEPKEIVPPSTKEEWASLTMKRYKFTLGLLEKTGKTLIEIQGDEVENGEYLVKYKTPIVF